MSQSIDQVLHQAIAHHQSGQLQEAGELYQAILQSQPNHPEANHNLGVIAVQIKLPAAGLPYFVVALDAEPTRGQFWLSYIDALFQDGQLETAREVIALAQQQGLEGVEAEALALRLEGGSQSAEYPSALEESLPISSAVSQNSTKKPSIQEIDSLAALFTEGRLTEATTLAQEMTARCPQHEFGWKALGAIFKQMGRSADALAPMQKAAALSPNDVEAQYNLGVTLQDLGRLNEAEDSYRRALQINPDYVDAHSNLGATLRGLGRLDEAEVSLRRAMEIKPDNTEVLSNLGVILHELGRLDEAEVSSRRALQIKPDNAAAHSNLGNTLRDLHRLDEAVASYQRALQIKPDYADAHFNLGNTLKELGRFDEAVASYQRALQIKPDYAYAHFNLGNTLNELGRHDEAETSYRCALQINPNFAEAHYFLGLTLNDLGRMNEAVVSFRQALQINPDNAEAHHILGFTLQKLGRLYEAEASYRQALQINPDNAEAHCNLGVAIGDMGRLDEAETSYRRALQIKPDYALAHCNLGRIFWDLGHLGEAEACWRQALQLKPDFALAHSNLLFCLTQNPTVDAETLFSEHCRFGAQFESPLLANCPQFTNSPNADRALRIGFVSGDLRDHAVAYFIEPVLAHLSNYPQLTLYAYYNHVIDDNVTQRLRKHFAHWNFIAGLSDADLAEKIRADNIDILIDLSGHTAKNRLLTFACKPAPVQASWIGYPSTTGLSTMDYYLADRFYLPLGQFDNQFTEKIVQMPAAGSFLPHMGSPHDVNALPALKNGHVTFGSFNRPSKLNQAVIALWSQLLRALPDSRMLLGAMPEKGQYDTLIEWFAQEGIPRERLIFYPRMDMDAYLALHHQVDICLDTFPYNGGTTTIHALWMGVPTLTLAGGTAAGRSGATLLGHVGLDEFIASDMADFVQKGLSLATNLAALSDIRIGLRERFANSAIGQPALVAAGVERTLRIMWQRWCNGLPAKSFEVTLQDINSMMQGTNN
jgi:predicted O-linked N-acetylglucosamine transferase (SPINDLY family)